MNKLSIERRAQIIVCLVEGNSVRATWRLSNSSKDAVLKLAADAGKPCLEYQREHLRNLPCKRIQCDEIWSFVYAKVRCSVQDDTYARGSAAVPSHASESSL